MVIQQNRSFNCKKEELPIISGFVATSFERDLTNFSGYSPVFDAIYVEGFKAKITAVEELVNPKSETLALKLINEHSYSILDGLIGSINHLEGYISLAGEKVLTQLHTVNSNITNYLDELKEKGLTDALVASFTDAVTLLNSDKKEGYKLISNRAALVQNNMGMLNDLNDQMVSICDIGKIFFKQTDKAKLKDYTFAQLLKKVRRTEKPEGTKTMDQPVTTDNNNITEPIN